MAHNYRLKTHTVAQNREKIKDNWEIEDYKGQRWDYSDKGKQMRHKNGINTQHITHLFDNYNKEELNRYITDLVIDKLCDLGVETNEKLMQNNYNDDITLYGLIGLKDKKYSMYGYDITASKIKITIKRDSLRIIKTDKWVQEKDFVTGNIKNKLEFEYRHTAYDFEYEISDYNKHSININRANFVHNKNDIILMLNKVVV